MLSDNSNVTVAISGGGTLGGTLTQPAVDGVATFNNLSIDNAGHRLHPDGGRRQPERGHFEQLQHYGDGNADISMHDA